MTNSSLVKWVNSWFYNPGSPMTPEKERMWCFIASVVLITEFMRGDPPRAVQKNAHDLLTYTLLGWNPITAWIHKSEYPRSTSESEIIVGRYETKVAVKNLLDFSAHSSVNANYMLVTNAHKVFDTFCKKSASNYVGEYVTMVMLAMWLFDRRTELPKNDLVAIRACLDLFYRSRANSLEDIDTEYADASSTLKYGLWINQHVDRMLTEHVTANELLNRLSYFAWFGSLVRAERIIRVVRRNEEWVTELKSVLEAEVERMRGILNSADLKVQQSNEPKSNPLGVVKLLEIFHTHPPKVRIKQMTKEK